MHKAQKTSEVFWELFFSKPEIILENKNKAVSKLQTVENKSLFSPIINLGREFYLTHIT